MIKIAFCGQPEYFRCLYEKDLDKHYEVREYQINMCGDGIEKIRRYQEILKDDSDIVFFFRGEFVPEKILKEVKGIKVQLSSEPIPTETFYTNDRVERLKLLTMNKNKFDFFYHYDKTSIKLLEANGFKVDGEFIFPVATEFYKPTKDREIKDNWDAGFFGRSTEHREILLGVPKRDLNILHVAHGVIGKTFSDLIKNCKLGLNLHCDVWPSLEHRMQNMMACGVPVISEPLTHNDCLKPGKHFIEFNCAKNNKDLNEKLDYYLTNEKELEKFAKQGYEFVKNNLNSVKCFKELINKILR